MAFPRRRLNDWYRDHGRHALPWRLTRDAYAVLVSEVMLQQTQVSRVEPAYAAWMERWPTAEALAASPPDEVIRAWSGMGYNRRAINLWRAAIIVAERFDGNVPDAPALLRSLPGVGPYTAAAVASFAGERRVAVCDTNIARVVSRAVLGKASARQSAAKHIDAAATNLLPRGGAAARDHNLALMDLGALVCSGRRPDCAPCPLAGICAWKRAGFPAAPEHSAPSIRFETTSRFARGRLVQALRETPSMDRAALAACLPPLHASRLDGYLNALVVDGLVVYDGGAAAWSLPQGNNSIASPKL